MFPEFFSLGRFSVRAYGVMLFISFIVGLFYVRKMAKSKGVDPDFTINLSFLVIVCGVLGARLFYVFYHWSEFSSNLLDIINPFGSSGTIGIAGLNLYGGLICAIVAAVVYIRIKKQPFWNTMDLYAPTIALGTFFTRIGCFLNGCCFGKECTHSLGIHFPEGSIPYSVFGDVAIHPTQIYMSLFGLILFLFLYFIDKKPHFSGMIFSVFLVCEAFFRFVVEFVRYYEHAMFVPMIGSEFTYNHLVAILLFIAGWILFFILKSRNKAM